jgi:Dockerin type I domain
MQDDFNKNFPSLNIAILAVNEHGQESSNGIAVTDRKLPLLQDVDADSNGQSDVWGSWDVVWRDVRILDKQNNLRTDTAPNAPVYNLTTNNLGVEANYNYLKSRLIAAADRVPVTPWQSPIEPLDVNNNGSLNPTDALLVINRLDRYPPDGILPALGIGETPDAYVDVTGDGIVAPLDALRVINQLSRNSASANGRSVDADSLDSDPTSDSAGRPESVPTMPWNPTDRPTPLTTKNPRSLDAWWVDAVFGQA